MIAHICDDMDNDWYQITKSPWIDFYGRRHDSWFLEITIYDNVNTETIEIKYCPFCGEKLENEIYM